MPPRIPSSLQPLRRFRNIPDRDLSIAAAVGELTRTVERQHRQVGGAAEAWAKVVPAELAGKAELLRLTRGVLNVKASDAAARFALDRFLRGGGERALITTSRGKIKRVRLS